MNCLRVTVILVSSHTAGERSSRSDAADPRPDRPTLRWRLRCERFVHGERHFAAGAAPVASARSPGRARSSTVPLAAERATTWISR
jgi:hypothetical protein